MPQLFTALRVLGRHTVMKSALGVLPLLGCLRPLIAQAGSGAEHALLPLLSLLAATVCAELAVFPIAAAAFSRVTIAGLALNFVAVPLMTVTQLGGMCAIGAGLLEGALAAPFGYAAHLAAAGIVESARFVDVVPWLAYRVPAPAPPLTVGCYYGGLALCLFGGRKRLVRAGGAGLALGAGAATALGPVDVSMRSATTAGAQDTMRVLFLDVDQADATLVQLPGGRSLLVDAGGVVRGSFPVGERFVAPTLWHAGVRRLDYLALTHGDLDHVGGASRTFALGRSGRASRCPDRSVSVTFRQSPSLAVWHGAACKPVT